MSSCYKKEIQVGSDLAESHTRIITVDTIGVLLSSYVKDSFVTANKGLALIGNYHDTYTGKTNASTFFQIGLPTLSEDAATLLPKTAVYDSIVLYMRGNGYYYGDTTQPFDISVYELNQQPTPEENHIDAYNTSDVPVKTVPLVTGSKILRPSSKDSIVLRLPQALGQDFYTKIQTKANQFTSANLFLEYFKGLAIKPTNTNSGAVYGFNMTDSSIIVRLHYHLTLPVKQDKVIQFALTRTNYQFNRIITDRTGTTLQKSSPEQREFFATATNPFAITQTGTGVYLKALFPTLREVLKINDVVRLMDARLILKPVRGSYNYYGNKLPNPLFLQTTDASNEATGTILDTTGQGVQQRAPVIDDVYGVNTNYSFNITSYINALLNTPGTAENGLFIMEAEMGAAKQINRAVIGSRQNEFYQTKLILNLLTIE
ncbi:DUF4270 family protein [Niastella sp. OAS944]|uniref:DUF4270 family protein n=1 Tax=Niastella sp. OAS944 TaxID=2664089 RepID=UPI0035C7B11C|nr:hypothetical protein [Chitinophagaceae bacterium OAS944]